MSEDPSRYPPPQRFERADGLTTPRERFWLASVFLLYLLTVGSWAYCYAAAERLRFEETWASMYAPWVGPSKPNRPHRAPTWEAMER